MKLDKAGAKIVTEKSNSKPLDGLKDAEEALNNDAQNAANNTPTPTPPAEQDHGTNNMNSWEIDTQY